jgi:hypothetical protein
MTNDDAPLEGRTIRVFRPATFDEAEELGFDGTGRFGDTVIVIELDDGRLLVPSRDPEGNGPGALFMKAANGVFSVFPEDVV